MSELVTNIRTMHSSLKKVMNANTVEPRSEQIIAYRQNGAG
jgi:hypothetical protein